MEDHKSLYKDQRSHMPRQHTSINRKLQEDTRAKHRRDRFQNSRKISLSPDRRIKEQPITVCTENKENINEQNPNRLARIVSNTEKLTKQEEFIKRFIKWKEAKKSAIISAKKKNFANCTINSRQTTNSSSLVPRGHHKEFRPPVGLKNTWKVDKVEENKNPVKEKGRQSVYTLVPTPTKKQTLEKSTSKFPIARKALPTNLHAKLLDSNKPSNSAMALVQNGTETQISNNKNGKTPSGLKKGLLRKSPTKSAAKNAVVKVAKSLERRPKTTATQQPARKDLKPRVLKMAPPLSTKPISITIKKTGGAVAKIKALPPKNKENVKPTKKSPLKNSRLAQTLKAKKPLNNKKGNLTSLKINGKKMLNIMKSSEPNENMVVQTPRDFASFNPFSEFVTSTKIKESSQTIKIDGISQIEPSSKKSQGNSSAKRNILAKEYDQNYLKATKGEINQNVKRFNFIRYSETKTTDDKGETNNEDGEIIPLTDENEGTDFVDKTPTKSGREERLSNYLSPFVSVTRGKVSLKKEKEKRNSLYLQNTTGSPSNLASEIEKQNSPKYSVEVRRTLEAVRYFRKQLQDEIDRLHVLCDIWETYKEENLEKIQNANGEDMINVTIGQTRLLTSKKFMQFKGLIDRCEAGATGIGNIEYNGSEDTKPITSGDLEGFWSMLGLQVDNLDKRFENLNLWKSNDWMDPEEVKPIKKNNLRKVKKPKPAPAVKSKSSSALQQMLRKMQAEMKKNKNKNDDYDTNEIVVLTSSKQKHRRSASSNNSTPRKSLDPSGSHSVSITVKDRKYFSPVKTVISFSSNRRASLRRKSSQELPKFGNSLQNLSNDCNDLRKSVLINEKTRRDSLNPMSPMKKNNSENAQDAIGVNDKLIEFSPEETKKETSPHMSPVPTVRKSILKTPGTAKSRLRNVIFNEKLRVKKFNFLINDNEDEANDTHEEDLVKFCEDETLTNNIPERTLTLRSRKVRLRPSCEIVIPKN